ncbi:MAG: hypothetical protein ACOCYP_00700 [Planctomycetota bacterium]
MPRPDRNDRPARPGAQSGRADLRRERPGAARKPAAGRKSAAARKSESTRAAAARRKNESARKPATAKKPAAARAPRSAAPPARGKGANRSPDNPRRAQASARSSRSGPKPQRGAGETPNDQPQTDEDLPQRQPPKLSTVIGLSVGGGMLLIVLLYLVFGGTGNRRRTYSGGMDREAGGGGGDMRSSHPQARPLPAGPSPEEKRRMAEAEQRIGEAQAHLRDNPDAYADAWRMLEMAGRVAHDTPVAEKVLTEAEKLKRAWDAAARRELAAVERRAARLEQAGAADAALAAWREFDRQLLPRVEPEVYAHRDRLRAQVGTGDAPTLAGTKSELVDLLLAGKAAATRLQAANLRADGLFPDENPFFAATVAVAEALERRQRVERRALNDRLGKPITLATVDGPRPGELGPDDDEGVRLRTDEGMVKISWDQMTAEQVAELRGGWQPDSAHDQIVRALEALADTRPDVAREALDAAADHPLCPLLRERLDAQ